MMIIGNRKMTEGACFLGVLRMLNRTGSGGGMDKKRIRSGDIGESYKRKGDMCKEW